MKKVLTIILDGFGYREEERGNAIKAADMKCFNKVWEEFPHSVIEASEEAVGLSKGQFGNSEVGHMTIGAGRLLKQNETLVNEFLDSDINENETFKKLLELKDKDIHLMGLCSDGNVHSGIDDLLKLYELLVTNGFKKIHFHLITDGRDTPTTSAYKYISMVENSIKKHMIGDIATICGRYYAMDRDNNMDRTQKYYDLVTLGSGVKANDIQYTLNYFYNNDITDEFMKPIVVNTRSLIKRDDVLLWFNYRADRARQIIGMFRNGLYKDMEIFSFFKISNEIETNEFINEPEVTNSLGVYLSNLGLTQARIAESEKYPHVTFFFDGCKDIKLPKCTYAHIPSPEVATYDLMPQMSAVDVTKKCISCMEQDIDFILLNYANPDMVGHTGDFEAAVKACIAVDVCLNKLIEVAEENFYRVIILADHGNADIMFDENNNPVTTHTTSPVPFIIMDKNVSLKPTGDLTMVAPTILEYMDIALPDEMKETDNLLVKNN